MFQDSDLPAVHDLIHRTIDACYPAAYSPRAVAFFKEFHSLDAILDRARSGCVLVVERDDGIVATGAVVESEVTGVFVDPAFQGEGLGASVMDELEAVAASAGHDSVHLSVSLPSRGFYEHRGYRGLEERTIDVGDGQRLDYWEASWPLTAES